jgi:DNA repair protein RecN (Recombination protein N)
VLRQLHITGLGVIDDVDLELDPGLNVLTGETGTGKTMVTVGLSLALGARATASLVRHGARAACVQARFDLPEEVEVDPGWVEDDELLLARTVATDGRGSARIGGQLATASALSGLGASLVELHGQHQAQRLLSSSMQTAFLDRFAGRDHLGALNEYREAFERLRLIRATLEDLRKASRDRERELDLLAYQVREIEALAPRTGETAELLAAEARLGQVERLLELVGGASDTLASDGGGADALGSVAASLEVASDLDPAVAALTLEARSLAAGSSELARDVRAYLESLSVDPERLQQIRERLAALRLLQRKYGETDEEVLGYLAEASDRLAALAGAGDTLGSLTAEADELGTRVAEQAARISEGRGAAAPVLAGSIAAELAELGMPAAEVEIRLNPIDELSSCGAETVELRLVAGEGQPPLALAKTASGGELSRTMLACRSVLADLDEVPTLVFDEVDSGIGGQAGLAVGRRLARLAEGRQVVVVTHLPQIACFADRHFRVRKNAGTASVEVLGDVERVKELSRMLAGLEESQSAELHAEELLMEAARSKGD